MLAALRPVAAGRPAAGGQVKGAVPILLGAFIDWAGVVLLAAAVVAVLAALSGFSGLGLDAAAAAGLLGCGAALGAGFVLREGRAASPLIEVALLCSRSLLAGLGAAFAGYLVLFALLFAVPLVLDARGARRGDRPGPDRAALACGLGLGLFTPANNAVMSAAPASRSGVLGGVLNMSRPAGDVTITERQRSRRRRARTGRGDLTDGLHPLCSPSSERRPPARMTASPEGTTTSPSRVIEVTRTPLGSPAPRRLLPAAGESAVILTSKRPDPGPRPPMRSTVAIRGLFVGWWSWPASCSSPARPSASG